MGQTGSTLVARERISILAGLSRPHSGLRRCIDKLAISRVRVLEKFKSLPVAITTWRGDSEHSHALKTVKRPGDRSSAKRFTGMIEWPNFLLQIADSILLQRRSLLLASVRSLVRMFLDGEDIDER